MLHNNNNQINKTITIIVDVEIRSALNDQLTCNTMGE